MRSIDFSKLSYYVDCILKINGEKIEMANSFKVLRFINDCKLGCEAHHNQTHDKQECFSVKSIPSA